MSCSSSEKPDGQSITIVKGIKVTQVVTANAIPPWNWHLELWRS